MTIDFAALVSDYKRRYGAAFEPTLDTLFLIELIIKCTGNLPAISEPLKRDVTVSEETPMNATPEQAAELSIALAKAQAEFTQIKRDRTVTVRTKAGGTYSFSYAPLESILRATMPALAKHGLALTQAVEEGTLVTKLLCNGTILENRLPILVREEGPQAYGSALTYARRYGITLLLGICADDDDDANLAEGNEAHESIPSPPAGFTPWWANLEAAVENGSEALSVAWGAGEKVHRQYAAKHCEKAWNDLKHRAEAAK
jgi:hypothetical protein